jgi:hypothetical protein
MQIDIGVREKRASIIKACRNGIGIIRVVTVKNSGTPWRHQRKSGVQRALALNARLYLFFE